MNAGDAQRSRYFRSFSSVRYPVQPRGELELPEALELTTYYEARYDESGRLIQFAKRLRVENKWETAFVEEYDYLSSSKNLQRRTLKVAGQEEQVWELGGASHPWSAYFDDFCGQWFGEAEKVLNPTDDAETPSLALLSLLAHEQLTEVEERAFGALVGTAQDNEWAAKVTGKLLDGARQIILEIVPQADPKLCALAFGTSGHITLNAFDEPPISLGGVIDSWVASHPQESELGTITLQASRDLDEMGRKWAVASLVETITFTAIQVPHKGRSVVAATLFLLTSHHLSNGQECVAKSIFRRLSQQIQRVIEVALAYEIAVANDE